MSKFITALAASTALTGAELLETAQLSLTVKISATTISAAAADNSYNDSANGFVTAGFAIGDRVNVSGFTAHVVNNLLVGTITALTAAKMTIGGTDGDVIVDNIAGDTVVIAKWVSANVTPDAIVGRSAFAAFASKISPAAIAANTNDYNPANLATSSRLRISSTAAFNLTGIAAPATDGRVLILANVGAFTITLKNQDAGSTAANRFVFGADVALAADASIILVYDATVSRWRMSGVAASGGGGGGGGGLLGKTHLKLGANLAIAWAWVAITWDTSVEDNLSAWSGGSPTQVTVPASVTHVRVSGLLVANPPGGGATSYCYVVNVTQGYILFAANRANVSGVWSMFDFNTALEQVTAGDVLQVIYNPGGASATLLGGAADANIAHLNTTFGRPTRVVFEWS